MINIGTVMEIYENEVLVMTSDVELIYLKKSPKKFLGQQVCFSESDIVKPGVRKLKYVLASGIAAIFMVALIAVHLIQNISISPQNISYAFIDMDINPSIGFFIDDKNIVQEVSPLNSDAENLTKDLSLEHLHVTEAVKQVIDKSKETGILNENENSVIMISGSLNPENSDYNVKKDNLELKLNQLLTSLADIDNTLADKSYTIKIVQVEPEMKKQAMENGLSSGRQLILEKAQSEGIDLTLEDAKSDSISFLIRKVGLDEQPTDKGPLDLPMESIVSIEPTGVVEPTPAPVSPNIEPTATKTPAASMGIEPVASKTPASSSSVEPTASKSPAASMSREPAPSKTPIAPESMKPSITPKSPVASHDAIKIQYYDSTPNGNDIIQINSVFKLINTGNTTINLKDVTFRYYYTIDSESPQFLDYWAQEGESSLTYRFVKMSKPTEKADYYLEVGFLGGQLNPGKETVVVTWFNKEDWSIYNQKNDYSYNLSSFYTYHDWKYVTGYICGELKWGIEPGN